jgi:hypothetical protein
MLWYYNEACRLTDPWEVITMSKPVSTDPLRAPYEADSIIEIKNKLLALQIDLLDRMETAKALQKQILSLDITEKMYSEMDNEINILLKDYKEMYLKYILSRS